MATEGQATHTLAGIAAGVDAALQLTPSGFLQTADWKASLALLGYAYQTTGTADRGDGETSEVGAANMAIDPLEPSFMFDVPTGTTVFPLTVTVGIEDMAGTNNIVAIAYDDINRYTSGGVAAVEARNLRTDDPRASTVTNLYSGDSVDLTTLTASDPRFIEFYHNAFVNEADMGVEHGWHWVADLPYAIVGPGSFMVYVHATGTGLEFTLNATWAEVPTTVVKP